MGVSCGTKVAMAGTNKDDDEDVGHDQVKPTRTDIHSACNPSPDTHTSKEGKKKENPTISSSSFARPSGVVATSPPSCLLTAFRSRNTHLLVAVELPEQEV